MYVCVHMALYISMCTRVCQSVRSMCVCARCVVLVCVYDLESKMVPLDDRAHQQVMHLIIRCNVSPITGFVRHTMQLYA